ncbi:MAG: Membrane-bound lytic murein transglycosylase [Pseudomonadota bacterium]
MPAMDAPPSLARRIRAGLDWLVRGLFYITHHSLAMVGLGVAVLVAALWFNEDWWNAVEDAGFEWMQERRLSTEWLPGTAADRAFARDLASLPAPQQAVAIWLGQKYRLAPEPMAAMVAEAQRLSRRTNLPTHLILAVASIESGFHPYAQSGAGAQGLMQVLTRVHTDRYASHGGRLAAFDPLTNLRVGTLLLRDLVRQRGTIEDGLRAYLGVESGVDDLGYVGKVLAEQNRLDLVASGQKVPVQDGNRPAP